MAYWPCNSIKKTMLISAPLLLGYAIGTVVILTILMAGNDPAQSLTESWELFTHELLWNRYQDRGYVQFDWSEFHTYPPRSPFRSASLTALLILFLSACGVCAQLCWSLRLARIPRLNMPDHEQRHIRKLWRTALSVNSAMTLRKTILIFAMGFVGAWIGLAFDIGIDKWNYERELRSLTPTFQTMPEPIFGWFTASDIVWITLALLGFAYFTTIRPARKRLAASKPLARRWCKGCGYPIGTIKSTNPIKVCPECGDQRE